MLQVLLLGPGGRCDITGMMLLSRDRSLLGRTDADAPGSARDNILHV
jgi:hypothetical protein